jgi:hypothetical protein
MPTNISRYEPHPPHCSHPQWSDILSDSLRKILQNANSLLITTTMRPHLMSQHLKPHPYHTKVSHYPLTAFWHHLQVSQHRCVSLIPLSFYFTQNPSFVPLLSLLTSCGVTEGLQSLTITQMIKYLSYREHTSWCRYSRCPQHHSNCSTIWLFGDEHHKVYLCLWEPLGV